MELIMPPTFSTCGQACIAMITGKSVEEVIKDMKADAPTSIGQLIEILDFNGSYKCRIYTLGIVVRWSIF